MNISIPHFYEYESGQKFRVSRLARLRNLLAHNKLWLNYFWFKSNQRPDGFLKARSRKLKIDFSIPFPALQVYKEIFMDDVYALDSLALSLPTTPIIVDIGANIGMFVLAALERFQNPRIFAYEPHPSNFQALGMLIEQSRNKHILAFPHAITGESNSLQSSSTMYCESLSQCSVLASTDSKFSEANKVPFHAETMSLESILIDNQLKRVDLLKLDCEGSEYDILYNTQSSTLQQIDKIVLEAHDLHQNDHNSVEICKYLESTGFAVNSFRISSDAHMVFAARQGIA